MEQAKKWCLWVEDALEAACQEAEGLLRGFEKIVERSVSITTTPPDKASLCFVSNQAEKKDVSILASAVDAKAQFLVTFNVKDYWQSVPGYMILFYPWAYTYYMRCSRLVPPHLFASVVIIRAPG